MKRVEDQQSNGSNLDDYPISLDYWLRAPLKSQGSEIAKVSKYNIQDSQPDKIRNKGVQIEVK